MSVYKYKKISLSLDPSRSEDKKIIDWMMKHKTRQLKFSDMLKEAMIEYIKRFEKKAKGT